MQCCACMCPGVSYKYYIFNWDFNLDVKLSIPPGLAFLLTCSWLQVDPNSSMGSCNDGNINFDLINLVQGLYLKRPNNLRQNCLLFHLCKLLSYAVPCSSRKGHICIGINRPEIRISSSLVTLKNEWSMNWNESKLYIQSQSKSNNNRQIVSP